MGKLLGSSPTPITTTCLTRQNESVPIKIFIQYSKERLSSAFLALSFFLYIIFSRKHKRKQKTENRKQKIFLEKMEGEGKSSLAAANDQKRRKFKTICVFCGSRAGYKSSFSEAALELGKQMVERKIDLVYGGGSVGLMGLISQTVFNGGCRVLGVIPKALMPHEISGETIGEVKTVADMHQRKSEMAKHADAFIALPGGYGTMEELLEMITWSQLGIHEKPVGLLNVDGYYDSLLALFDKGVEEGFIGDSARRIVVMADSAEELINRMEEYAPAHDKVAPRQSWEVDQLLDSTRSGET